MSRADRFDRGDFEARYPDRRAQTSETPSSRAPRPPAQASSGKTPARTQRAIWPLALDQIRRVGESVLADRDGHGRPHKGLDIFAEAGTDVLAAREGRVLRVVDGRQSMHIAQRRAGLFVDVQGADALVYRYLHIGAVHVTAGASVRQGAVLGTVAPPFTSGLAETPHLHFEIRQGDFDRARGDYGAPVDPRRLLPPLRA
jgi:murein DD-endopeptidase MepM/ murein hydrolase activator NlpD